MFADNEYVLALFTKEITFSLKKTTTLQKKLLQIGNNQMVLPLQTQRIDTDLRSSLKKCGNLKVVVDDGELTRNINKKKKPEVLQAYRFPLCG